MGHQLDSQRLNLVFASRPDILQGIQKAADSPSRISLFNEIATHVYEQVQGNEGPAQKKRKVDAVTTTTTNGLGAVGSNPSEEPILLEVKEISVSVPQRKKFELCFTAGHIYARAPGTTAPIPGITYRWKDIEYVFYLPVPEKAQVQHNYIIFPRGSNLPTKADQGQAIAEPLVFTIPATAPKQGTIGGQEATAAATVSDTYKSLFHWAIGNRLRAAGNSTAKIVAADPNKFCSQIRQPHRPNEKAVHICGYRGSKDGFLFFLENGILWGFKKPLIFIPVNRIHAISYTNILQVTFNIVVEVMLAGDSTEEYEFSMLDQQDYGGIDAYIKFHRLQDSSMAEQRKAKIQLAENKGPKKAAAAEKGAAAANDTENGDAAGQQNGMTVLEQAQADLEQQLQDEEDEEEEDYDPGSESDSDGSGTSSEEDHSDGEGAVEDDEDDDEEADEEEEQEEAKEERKQEVKTEKPTTTAATRSRRTAAVPVRNGGWATIQRPSDNMDVDEKFDVVG